MIENLPRTCKALSSIFSITHIKKLDKEVHYILVKGTNQQEDIMTAKIYALNIGTPNFIKQLLLDMKRPIGNNSW